MTFFKEIIKEIIGHFLATLVWLIFVTLLKDLSRNLIYLWLGAFAGTFILDIDHLIYWFWFRPEKQDSLLAKMLWRKRDFSGLLALLARYHDTHTRLIFHTALFQVILLIVSLYIFTSGGSYFGSGLVAALNIHLLKDVAEEYLRKRYGHLNNWLFWQIGKKISAEAQKIYLLSVTFVFILLSLLI